MALLNPYLPKTPLSQDLLAYWSFEEGDGVSTADLSRNGHVGTLTSSALWTASAEVGGALQLDGTNYVNLGTGTNLLGLGDDWTILVWVYIDPIAEDAHTEMLDLGYQAGDNNPACMGINAYIAGSGYVAFRVEDYDYLASYGAGSITYGYFSTTATVGTGWHLVAMTRSNAKAECYIKSATMDVYEVDTTGIPSLTPGTWASRKHHIGARTSGGADDSYLHGAPLNRVDEIGVWGRVLSKEEIAYLFERRARPVFGWSPLSLFADGTDEGFLVPSITEAVKAGRLWQTSARVDKATAVNHPVGAVDDWSGNGNNALQATVGRRPLLKQDAAGEWYLDFDGTDDGLFTAEIATTGTGEHAAAAVVSLDKVTGVQMIMEVDEYAAVNRYAQLLRANDADFETIAFESDVDPIIDSYGATLSTGTLYTLRENTTASLCEGFIDGVGSGGTAVVNPLSTLDDTLGIGAAYDTNNINNFDGKLYSAMFICRALTATEAAKLDHYLSLLKS